MNCPHKIYPQTDQSLTNHNHNTNHNSLSIKHVFLNLSYTFESVIVPLQIAKNNRANLLLDTGSRITLIKKSCVMDDTICYIDQKIELKGISEDTVPTYGICYSNLDLSGSVVNHPIHLVKDDFPIIYDGILGQDFILKYKVNLDFHKNVLSFVHNEKEIVWKINPNPPQTLDITEINNIILKPRSESIQKIKINQLGESLCLSQEIAEGVFMGNCLINPTDDGHCNVAVINNNDFEVTINDPKLIIESLNSYNIYQLQDRYALTTDRLSRLSKAIRTDHMNREQLDSILDICKNYHDIFYLSGDTLSFTPTTEHNISTTDENPIYIKPYRLPFQQQSEIKAQVDKMLTDNIIKESNSPYNSPLLIVPKKPDIHGNKKWRVVVDFRKLNEKTIGDAYPLPNITEILDQLGNSKYFSSLDLASGYHQVTMSQKDQQKTAFSTPFGHYEFNRMPFGLKGAPATFQRMMNSVLTGLQGFKCFVYLDDVIIYGKTLDDHNSKLKSIFERLRTHNLKLQPDKCEFLRHELNYLGHVITEEGTVPDPAKIRAVQSFPIPNCPRDIKSFLGLAGYYRRYIYDFAKLAQPLNVLLKKDAPFNWNASCLESFESLKSKLCNAPILIYPDFTREFILTTDASNKAIGGILSQGTIGRDLPIAYASRILNKAELNYSTIEKELLAICWSVKHFRPYLYGRKFTIVTDHKPLTWLFSIKDPGSRLIRFRLKLEEYEYNIVHKAGKNNTNADALSRMYPISNTNSELSYEAFLSQRTLTNNKNIHEVEYSIANADPKQFRVIFVSDNTNIPDLHNSDVNELLKSKPFIVNHPVLITHDHINYVFIKTHELNERPTESTVFTSVNTLKTFCIDKKINELSVRNFVKAYPYRHLKFENIRLIFRFIFNQSKIHITFYHNQITDKLSKREIDAILNEYHSTPTGGHKGIRKTYKKIKTRYKWENMYKDIKTFVSSCEHCQRNKQAKSTKMPLTITTTARKPFEKVFLDIVGPLPVTENLNKYLLTFEDDLTKFSLAVPIPNQEAITVATAFVTKIICIFGTPKCLLTDRGTNFTSDLMKNVCQLLKIKKIQTCAFRPQSNGSLERSHRNISEFLRHFINKDQTNWDEWVPYAMFTYNTSEHSATNYTPFKLIFGNEPEIPNSLKQTPELNYNYDDYAVELKLRLQHSHEIARDSLIRGKEKSKIYYDKYTNPVKIKIGDKVLLKNEVNTRGRSKKLEPVYHGPFEVVEIHDPVNTTIRIKRKLVKVHNNRLKVCNT